MSKLVILALFAVLAAVCQAEDVPLTIPQGDLVGLRIQSNLLKWYYAFKSIPYAQPPVGPLRFRSPRPHQGWTGVWDAREQRSSCLQPGYLSGCSGSEDCLFLNVNSPNLNGNRQVIVWIHGGGFNQGSGSTRFYGPEPLINEDNVLVTVNYRLGPLGFLSTGDRNASGNWGLKDILEALQWVQDNIRYFGGDPSRVTVAGESTGAALVHLLVLSSSARGLFSQAIMQSGVANAPWAFNPNPAPNAFDFGKRLGIETTSSAELVNRLRTFSDLTAICKATDTIGDHQSPRGHYPFQFTPVAEPEYDEPPFITDSPINIMKNKAWNDVPCIIGTNSEEGLYAARELVIDPFLFSRYNRDPTIIAPPTWNIAPTRIGPVTKQILVEYFTNEEFKDQFEYIQYTTDAHFHYPIWVAVQLMASKVRPLYFYYFDFEGDLNHVKRLLFLGDFKGVIHADEIPYLFRIAGIPAPILPGNPAYVTRARMTQMWTNFAASGDPTPLPTGTIPTLWNRVRDGSEFMWITEDMVNSKDLKNDRMQFWAKLEQDFNQDF